MQNTTRPDFIPEGQEHLYPARAIAPEGQDWVPPTEAEKLAGDREEIETAVKWGLRPEWHLEAFDDWCQCLESHSDVPFDEAYLEMFSQRDPEAREPLPEPTREDLIEHERPVTPAEKQKAAKAKAAEAKA